MLSLCRAAARLRCHQGGVPAHRRPTDTMPLTRRAKGLMAVESVISYAAVSLVVARAVNVLGAGH